MNLITIDPKLFDKNKLRSGVIDITEGMEPGIGSPVNIDKVILSGLAAFLNSLIDSIPGPMVVGATPAEATNFLGGFSGVPAANAALVMANPILVDKLQAKHHHGNPVFSHDEQQKILANIDWLQLLLTLAPIIFKILMMFLV